MMYPFEQFLDHMEDGLCFIDAQCRLLYFNQAFRKRLAGIPKAEGEKCCRYFPGWLIDCPDCVVSRALSSGKRQHRVFAARENGRAVNSLEIGVQPIPEKGQAAPFATVTFSNPDCGSVNMDSGIAFPAVSLQEKATHTLLTGIAHNYNNALMGIRVNVDMIQRHTQLADYLRRYVDPLQKSVRKMTRLTDQLMSCVHGGKYQPCQVTIKELIGQTLVLAGEPAGVELDLDSSCEFFVVHVDSAQIQSALISILKNAEEAIADMDGEGRILVHCKVDNQRGKKKCKSAADSERVYARIIVADNGRGMNRETRDRIFEPFYSTKFPGHGLSMAAAQGIITRHGGSIAIDSRRGHGSRVTVFLPADSIWKPPDERAADNALQTSGLPYKESSY